VLQTEKTHIVTGHGAPVDNRGASLTVGPRGPILLQDITFLDELAHFDRERIPERVVHAKGAGESVSLTFQCLLLSLRVSILMMFIFYSVHAEFVVNFLRILPFYFSIIPSSQICFKDNFTGLQAVK
jgi:hypothetical protein